MSSGGDNFLWERVALRLTIFYYINLIFQRSDVLLALDVDLMGASLSLEKELFFFCKRYMQSSDLLSQLFIFGI